jgi:hypothetical protein
MSLGLTPIQGQKGHHLTEMGRLLAVLEGVEADRERQD